MKIEVLGTGCKKCKDLEENVKQAVNELGIEADIQKIEDLIKIMNYGVIATPALVIDGKVAFSGRSPTVDELKKIIEG